MEQKYLLKRDDDITCRVVNLLSSFSLSSAERVHE